ncbi:MAG: TonB-dependent receptor [Thermoanaerobaculia bacterium]
MLRRRYSLSLIALLVLVPAVLFAQMTTGTLVGTVMSGGSPLPGTTVSVSSPSLQGTRTAVTGEGGGYNLPALPPGKYLVTFELSGMQKVEKNVVVSVAQTSRADADLRVGSVSESLTVTADASSVSESTAVATNFTSEQINQLPISRSIDATTDLAPGVTSAGPNNQITISGATSFDNLFLVDGVVVNENLRGQPNPLYIEDAIQESTVLTGGISAEFGRFTGGVVSTITKSGGNEFSGSLRDSLTNPKWTRKSGFTSQADPIDSINSSYEGTLGGRIVRDRLWFFGAGRYNSQDLSRQTNLTNIPYVFNSDDKRYEGKLTGQLTPRHSLIGSFIDSREHRDNTVTTGRVVDLRSLTTFSRPKSLLSINYNGLLTSNFLLEGQFSRMRDRFTSGAETRDLIEGTLLVDDSAGVRGWSPTFCGSPCPAKQRNNKGYLGKGSYFLSTRASGSHNLTGGYDEFHQLRNENNFQSGSDLRIHGTYIISGAQTFFGVDPANGDQIEYDPVPALSKTSDFATRSVFFNDKWNLNSRLSFNAGVRYDKAFGKDQAGRKTVDDSAVSPRLAANFDVLGNGRHRFSATYGKYVSKVDQGPADNTAGAGRYASFYFDYKGPAINPAGTPASQLVPTQEVIRRVFQWFNSVGGVTNGALLTDAFIPGVTTRFDHSLKAPSMNEFTVGYSTALSARGFLRADYIHRVWKNFYTITRTLTTGISTDQYGNSYDQGVISNADQGLSRNYNALQLQGNYKLFGQVGLGGNYTYGRLRGNVEGETPSFATSITDFNNRAQYTGFAQYNPVGDLGPDMRHRANVWLTYDLPSPVGSFNFSLLQRYHSALPYSAVATIDVRKGTSNGPVNGVVNPGYKAPPSSVPYYFSRRGAFRVDNISETDLGLNWYLPAFRGTRAFVEADLLNILSRQGIEDPDFINQTVLTRRSTACKQASGVRCVAFNPFTETPVEGLNFQYGPTFGKPTSANAYQLPRTYRVSLGLKF